MRSNHTQQPPEDLRELTMQALADSEQHYRTLVESMGDGLVAVDRNGVITYANEALCRMVERPFREVVGRPATEFIHADDHEQFRSQFARRAAGDKGHYQQRLITSRGTTVHTLVTASPTYDPDGQFAGSFAVVKDVTGWQRMVDILRQSEARFRQLADLLPQVVFETDEQGRITFANRNSFEAFGYTRADLVRGINVLDVLVPEERERATEGIRRVLRGEQRDGDEYTALRSDGTTFPVAIYSRPIMREGRAAGMRGILIDLTERKDLEQQVLQAQKMQALGQLAGGVAHEINNMLTAILGNAQLLEYELQERADLLALVADIVAAARHSAALTRQLLAFSRRQVLHPHIINLNEVVAEIEPVLRGGTPENIQIVTELEEGLYPVEADPSQMAQVILNLVVNARDAMPEGGTLTVKTANVIVPQGTVSNQLPAGRCVMLAVSDTGIGMDEETRARLFEPFFTTKERIGAGLGLATVLGIVRQTGGDIVVRSAVGEGSTFAVYLPAAGREGDTMAHTRSVGEHLRGSETVLVVEDEEVVRGLMVELLSRFGYDVLQAESADAALALCRECDRRPDLMVTDVVMPGMDGIELVDAVSEIVPDIAVLFISGYAERSLALGDRLADRVRYLGKPFEVQEFLATIRDMLDGPRQ